MASAIALDIDSKVNAILARLQNSGLKKEERDTLRRILDTLLDAREDVILEELEKASAKVAAATRDIEEFTKSRSQRMQSPPIASPTPVDETNDSAAARHVEPNPANEIPIEFDRLITDVGLRYFKPYELLTKGATNSSPSSPAFGLNEAPPPAIWPNIIPTIRTLDQLRDRLKCPIVIASAYRTPAYNAAIGGARESQHIQFRAIDFVVRGITTGPQDWASALRDMRQSGVFRGGIGVYATFVHIDTRGNNADWGA